MTFQLNTLRFVQGDATLPQGDGPKVIAHVCNNRGGFGAGFALAVARRYPTAQRQYHRLEKYFLGAVQFVPVAEGLCVANMIAQDGFPTREKSCALDYEALEACFRSLVEYCCDPGLPTASVAMPRIGCGLAGGSWDKVAPLITRCLVARGVDVTVYDLP